MIFTVAILTWHFLADIYPRVMNAQRATVRVVAATQAACHIRPGLERVAARVGLGCDWIEKDALVGRNAYLIQIECRRVAAETNRTLAN